MFKKQFGFKPFLCFFIGLLFFLYFFAAAIYNSVGVFLYALKDQQGPMTLSDSLVQLFLMFVMLFSFLIFSSFGIVMMDAFPPIKVDDTGITVKTFLFVDHFDWDEVRTVYDARLSMKGAKAVILSPRGNFLINFVKYYPYYARGTMAGIQLEPVILISPGLQDREEILKFIGQQIRNQVAIEVAREKQKA